MNLWIQSVQRKSNLENNGVVMKVVSKSNLSPEGVIATWCHIDFIVGYLHFNMMYELQYVIHQQMRKHIELVFDPSLKGIEGRFCNLPFKAQTILKIVQKEHFIYSIYTPSNEVPEGKLFLSPKFCSLNAIEPGPAVIEPYLNQIQCTSLIAKVKPLDWQIINKKRIGIEEEFLNQIQLSWPNATLPLFYDNNNFVTLTIDCKDIVILRQNTAIQIIQQKENQPEKSQKKRQFYLKNGDIHQSLFGNINTVQLQDGNEDETYDLVVQIDPLHQTKKRSIKEHLEYIKQVRKKEKYKFPLQKIKKGDSMTINKYLKVCYQLNLENCKVVGEKREKNSPQYSLNFLIQSCKDFKIQIQFLNPEQNQQNITIFIKQTIAFLQKEGKIYLYSKFPFIFCSKLCYLNLIKGNQTLSQLTINYSNEKPLKSTEKMKQIIEVKQIVEEQKRNVLLQLREQIRKQKKKEIFPILYQIAYGEQISKIVENLQSQTPKNILLTSLANNGKTALSKILQAMGYQCKYVDLKQMDEISLTAGDIILYLESVFQTTPQSSILFFDNLDAICYHVDEGDVHRRQQRISSKIVLRKLNLFMKIYKRKIIMTTKQQSKIDEEFSSDMFLHVNLKNPTHEMRFSVVETYYKEKQKQFSQKEKQKLVAECESMSFGEFYKFLATGKKNANFSNEKIVLPDFSKLAGLKQAKVKIKSMIQKPLKYSSMFAKLPIKLSRGVLLYGGTGCGKTALGHALEGQFKMKYFNVKGSDILSKYIGGSEAAVRDIFEKGMSVSPSIIFFDQFQTIVPRRNSSNTGVTDRVVNQFLCYLDGVASMEGIFIVAASSRPDLIDPALLRPGRIDNHIYLEYPNDQERKQLLQLYKNSINVKMAKEEIAQKTTHYSYSDLVGLLKELRIKKSAQILHLQNKRIEDFKEIDEQMFMKVHGDYKIGVSEHQQKMEKVMHQKFKNGEPLDVSKQKLALQ